MTSGQWHTRSRSPGLTKRFGPVLAVDDLSFTVDEGRVVGFLGPERGRQDDHAADAARAGEPDGGQRDGARASRYGQLDDPVHTVGAVLDGGMLHPGPQRPQPPARARARRRGSATRASTSCSSSSRSRTRPTAARAATRSACASGSASRRRCSATRRCWCSTSPPTASTRRASAGCATSCAGSPPRAARSSSPATCWPRSRQTADDVVVINRGRSVAQAPLAEIMAAQRRRRREGRRPGRPPARRHPVRRRARRSRGDSAEILVARPQRRADRPPDRRAPDRDLRARAGRRRRWRTSTSSSPARPGGPS